MKNEKPEQVFCVPAPIRPYSKNELAILYGVARNTVYRWLRECVYDMPEYEAYCRRLPAKFVKTLFTYKYTPVVDHRVATELPYIFKWL